MAIAEANGTYFGSRMIRTGWALRNFNQMQTTNETDSESFHHYDRSKPIASSSSYSSVATEDMAIDSQSECVSDAPAQTKPSSSLISSRDADEPTVSSSRIEVFPFSPRSKLFSVYDVKAHSVSGHNFILFFLKSRLH